MCQTCVQLPIEGVLWSIRSTLYALTMGVYRVSTVVMWQLHMTGAHDPGVEPLDLMPGIHFYIVTRSSIFLRLSSRVSSHTIEIYR